MLRPISALLSYPWLLMYAFGYVTPHLRRCHVGRSRMCSSSPLDDLDNLMSEVLNSKNLSLIGEASSDHQGSMDGWIKIDWKREEKRIIPTPPSPVQEVWIRGRPVYMKRDDQLRLPGSQISGNKARKMLTLASMDGLPSCIVSYGGPQSNAMLALAAVVHFQNSHTRADDSKKVRFVYYTKKLPRFLQKQPNGNLFRALSLGMELVEVPNNSDYNDLFGGDFGGSPDPPANLPPPVYGQSVWIPQGGASDVALAGTHLLATEILAYWRERGYRRPLTVAVPGGTCSTAVLLHAAIESIQAQQSEKEQLDIKVLVVPCIGDMGYARRQMMSLKTHIQQQGDNSYSSSTSLPEVLPPLPLDQMDSTPSKANSYTRFGSPDPAVLEVFREMKDRCDVVLDLIYGAPVWKVLLNHWRSEAFWGSSDHPASSQYRGRELMYVHSGGVEGLNSQLMRYHYEGLVATEEVQFLAKQ